MIYLVLYKALKILMVKKGPAPEGVGLFILRKKRILNGSNMFCIHSCPSKEGRFFCAYFKKYCTKSIDTWYKIRYNKNK